MHNTILKVLGSKLYFECLLFGSNIQLTFDSQGRRGITNKDKLEVPLSCWFEILDYLGDLQRAINSGNYKKIYKLCDPDLDSIVLELLPIKIRSLLEDYSIAYDKITKKNKVRLK